MKFCTIKKILYADKDLSEMFRLLFKTNKAPLVPFSSEYLGCILVKNLEVNAYDRDNSQLVIVRNLERVQLKTSYKGHNGMS